MIEKIDHIGIVVENLESAMRLFSEGLGLDTKRVEVVQEFQVKIAFIPVGEVLVELVEPIGPGFVEDFLKQHGEGLHHICYRVTDIDRTLKEVGSKLELRDKKARLGGAGSKVAFLNPRKFLNVETEFVERSQEI